MNKAAILFAFYLLLLPGCRQERVAFSPDVLPSQVILDLTLDESMSGRRLWTLYASRAVVWEKDNRIDVDTIKIVFYDENGAPYSQLNADCGRVFTRTEDLVARGNVRVTTSDSTTLLTDSLAWDNSRRIVHTDADITIRTLKGTIWGKGLVSDASLERIEIKSEVRGSADYDFHH
ncbi:MAG: LPS export ABC transporter periplasmic protein LptC [candidate division WOR-3 bacterium]